MKLQKLFTVLLSTSALLASCNQSSDLSTVKTTGFLNVGITIYEPMYYFAEDGETITGFDAELAQAFAKSINAQARFTTIKWDSKILELNSRKIDVIWNGMTITDELKNNIDLTFSYATNYQCVVTKSENVSQYTSKDSIKGKKVAVEAGSAGEKVATDVATLNKVTSQEAALLEVKAGTSDCAIIDVTMANTVVGKGDFISLNTIDGKTIAFDKENFGVGCRKNSDLTVKINEFFKASYNDGTLASLGEKYNVAIDEESF